MKLLLLVQNENDVKHLPAAAQSILSSAITGVWVVFSPAITVDANEAASKLDAEIQQLVAAERAAADRTDYEAAKGYKTQREGKELDKAKAIRDAWKTADATAKQERTKAIFEPFTKALNPDGKGRISIKVTGHSEHFEREQWVQMLNSLSGVWFKPFAPGSFVVGWPESMETAIKDGLTPIGKGVSYQKITPPSETSIRQAPEPQKPASREDELMAMHHMSLKPLMNSLNLDPKGKSKEQMVKEILAAEAAPKAELESVETY